MTKKETGYSLLEVSVALGIAAIVAVPATATLGEEAIVGNTQTLASSNVFSDLEDVDIINPGIGEIIVFNGVTWVNQKLNLNFLGDVQLAIVPGEGDVVVFDGENWVNRAAPAPALSNLDNVDLASLAPGESLIWDGTNWVNGVGGIPGEILVWNGDAEDAPEGWLIADGRAVSRTTYAALFAEIGTTYGAGDGATTFNLPELSGRVPVGLDSTQTEFSTLGKTGGVKAVTLTEAQMPSHTHTQQAHGHEGTAASGGAHTHTGTAASAGAHTHTGTWSDTTTTHTHTGDLTFRRDSKGSGSGRTFLQYNAGTLTSSSSGNHTHSVSTVSSSGAHTHELSINSAGAHTHDVTVSETVAINDSAGGGEAHTNLMPYVTVNYIIKY